jgi:DHA1 family multidrug resistance protein-like MFS transporter
MISLTRILLTGKRMTLTTPGPFPFLLSAPGFPYSLSDRNWTFRKRAFVAFSISLLTFSIYIGSAIYTSSIPALMEEFHVSLTMATLGLTLYIIGTSRAVLS